MTANLQPAQRLAFKRGDTVMLGCAALDAFGLPASLVSIDVAAQARTQAGELVADLELRWVDRAGGTFELWAPADGLSTSWPLGNLAVDIRYTEPAQPGVRLRVQRSETFFLVMEKGVTA